MKNQIIAFLLVPEMRSRIPLKYKKTSMSELPGESVIYAGYPNDHDLLLFFGRIAGKAEDSLIMHSYAWMGSSGSVVVDMKGRIVWCFNCSRRGYVLHTSNY